MNSDQKGRALIDAARSGHWDTFDSLIDGANVNEWSGFRERAISFASHRGDVARVRRLIDARAEVNFHYYTNGITMVHRAFDLGHREMLQCLLENGADVNARDYNGETVLFLLPRDHMYAGMYENMILLLRYGADVMTRNSQGQRPHSPWVRVYQNVFATCRMAQRCWLRIFQIHQRGVLVPDIVKMISEMIWETRFTNYQPWEDLINSKKIKLNKRN